MTFYTDQLSRTLDIPHPPRRIISLVPSQTELLYDLGLRDEVVGITKFCLHPEEWFRTKARVGGTKKYDFEKIKALAPDLIIGNKEENERKQIETLMNIYPVWMSDIYSLKDAGDMIGKLGELLDKRPAAKTLQSAIEKAFTDLTAFRSHSAIAGKRVAYFIWRQPYMVAGSHTFIDHLLIHCGFINVFSGLQRYPEVTEEQLKTADPEVILLSSEPYPFKEKHVSEFQSICKNAKIMTVDGELFSWYGSRLLHAPPYFKKLIQTLS
jgi:ABC-type Fe3+-hydroxamate transport system substrate-binding protein